MGEIILVQLGNRSSFCELLSENLNGKRVRVRIGRNKEAKFPLNRVLLRTGQICKSHDDVVYFSERSRALKTEIDLKVAWEFFYRNENGVTLRDIARACGLDENNSYSTAAVLLCLEEDATYFYSTDGGFACHTREEIKDQIEKRTKESRKQKEISDLITDLETGKLPSNLTKDQKYELNHIREYAIHGDKYSRSGRVIELLSRVRPGSNESIQIYAYNKLTECGVLKIDHPREIDIAGIPKTFDNDVLLESSKLTDCFTSEKGLLDLTALDTFTIDNESTTDRDDAFSVVNETVWIHVTDISSLIPENSAIDSEASSRTATLYTPDITVPMLPENISEGLGSLDPDEDRQCLSIKLDPASGESSFDWSIHQTKIRSNASLSYQQADKILSDQDNPLYLTLSYVSEIMKTHEATRIRGGAFALNRPELNITVSEDQKIDLKVLQRGSPSRSMVAELMVTYNSRVGKYCADNRIPVPFRLQSEPEDSIPSEMPDGPLKWYLIGRLFKPAKLSTTTGIHSALGIENYVQASSPLRRYLDLVVQRQVIHHMRSRLKMYDDMEIITIANVADTQLRALRRIENDRLKYWFLKYLDTDYLESLKENTLKAVVLDNRTDRPGDFELTDFPYRGKCYFPTTVKPGDECYLKLNGVDLWHKTAQFSFLSKMEKLNPF